MWRYWYVRTKGIQCHSAESQTDCPGRLNNSRFISLFLLQADKVGHGWNWGFWQVDFPAEAPTPLAWERRLKHEAPVSWTVQGALIHNGNFWANKTVFCFCFVRIILGRKTRLQQSSCEAQVGPCLHFQQEMLYQIISVSGFWELRQVSGELHRVAQASSRHLLSDKASRCQHSECWVCCETLTSSRRPQTPRS